MEKHRHGGDIVSAAARFGIDPGAFVDFSVNTNPLGPPPEIAGLLRDAASLAAVYPEPDSGALREAAGAYYGVAPEQIIAANGAVELIYLLAQVQRPRTVLIPGPTFEEYEIACRLWGATIKHLYLSPGQGFLPRLPHLVRAARGTDLVWICNPNNPTGARLPAGILKPFLSYCREQGIFLVIDESFLLFDPDWRQLTCIPEAVTGGGILVIQSLTKFFGVPGLRVGCGIGSRDVIAGLARCQPPWQVNGLAQAAARASFAAGEYARQTRLLVAQERDFLATSLGELRLVRQVYPSAANFLLLELRPPATAPAVWKQLAQRGVLVRDCSNFGWLGDRFVRVAVKDHDQNTLLLKQLALLDEASADGAEA
ncbi:MAG: threonine-phosphate decarboxylase CobD [Thermacetogeniaceae bacterium]